MLKIGQFNHLIILEIADGLVYLDAKGRGEVCLPLREAPPDCQTNDTIEVFVYLGTEDTLVATRTEPYAYVGGFAYLQVVSMNSIGAFLDWGLPKDLLLPFREQTRDLKEGDWVSVYLYLDKSERISASMRFEKYVDKTLPPYEEEQEVELLIVSRTDLGFKAIINNRYLGVIYSNEVFQPLKSGDKVLGYIKKIRDDRKIDLSLQRSGHEVLTGIAEKIIGHLKSKGGFSSLSDKSSADEIYGQFGVSKKKYKMALGGLYKKLLITIEPDGIRLTSTPL